MAEINRHDDLQGAIVHEYDGIEEADNNLPLWWLAIFYGAIVFAIGYYFYYEGYAAAPIGRGAYDVEMAAQAAAAPQVTAEQLLALGEDADAIAAGHAVFLANCVVCHDDHAQGKIGPNLTDAYWIHGGSAMDIHHTIDQGYGAKGMPAWGATLGAESVNQAVAFILSIRNTNVEGKEAQGELFVADGLAPEGAEPEGPEPDAAAAPSGAGAPDAAAAPSDAGAPDAAAADAAAAAVENENEPSPEPSAADVDSDGQSAGSPPSE